MTGQEAETLFWETMRSFDWNETSGRQGTQEEQRIQCWEMVIRAINDEYRVELERLRQRVRDLQELVCTATESAVNH